MIRSLIWSSLVAAASANALGQCGFALIPLSDGPDGEVFASASYDPDGPGPMTPRLIVGGAFMSAGGVAARHVAMFDPATGTWTAMGDPAGTGAGGAGFNNDVLVLLSRPGDGGDELYAAGVFTGTGGDTSGIGRIAKWVPSAPGSTTGTWQQVGAGVDGTVRALAFNGGNLVAGGDFANSGAAPRQHVAQWDGVSWNAMGSLPRSVYALKRLDDGRVLAGLQLQQPFDLGPVVNVYAWNSSAGSWSGIGADPAPSDLYGTVRAFAQAEGMGAGDRPLLVAGDLYDGDLEYGGGTALRDEVVGSGGTWHRVGPWTQPAGFIASVGSVLPRPERATPDVLVALRRLRPSSPSLFTLASWRGGIGLDGFIYMVVHESDGRASAMTRVSFAGPIFLGGRFTVPVTSDNPQGAVFLARYVDVCCLPDLGGPGGLPGADGALNNNDFIAFVNFFFASSPVADMGSAGGLPGADGAWDNNDFIVFINRFFAGCV